MDSSKKSKNRRFQVAQFKAHFGSRLGMAGIDLGTIQELMGHKNFKMTKRYYHPTSAHKRNAVEVLDSVTTFFTTQANPDEHKKVVSIGIR